MDRQTQADWEDAKMAWGERLTKVNANNQTSMASVDFMEGFATTTGMILPEAREQWAAFSSQLSDSDLREVELGGYPSGVEMGQDFNRLYPKQRRTTDGEQVDWENTGFAYSDADPGL